jgi:hypothetical protein
MKIRELSVAIAELDQALGYYGRSQTRLAGALLDEVQTAKQSIMRAVNRPPGFPYTSI